MENKIGLPQQCIDTGKALKDAYGRDRALIFIQGNIDSLSEAYEQIRRKDTQLKLRIALQVDFWAQVLDSTETK